MNELRFSMEILNSIDSTNNYAMQKVHAGLASHGNGYFALEQTAGKGQRGKSWTAAHGENIILSVTVETLPVKGLEPFHLSVATALAAKDLLEKYAGNEVGIKWPNDIYWRDRKAGGILIENVLRGSE